MSVTKVDDGFCCACQMEERNDIQEYSPPPFRNIEEPWTLCELCASTFISSAVAYGYPDATLYQTLGTIGNMILDELKAIRKVVERDGD